MRRCIWLQPATCPALAFLLAMKCFLLITVRLACVVLRAVILQMLCATFRVLSGWPAPSPITVAVKTQRQ